MQFFTIGVYNSNKHDFFDKLVQNRIDTFCDIRQRRGVRGSKYSFVNSNKLQEELSDLGIKYGHIIGLAPTAEIRVLQKESDIANDQLKSERRNLSKTFTDEYEKRVLDNFNFELFFEQLDQQGANRIAFFCVEEFPDACHRSLVSRRLNEKYNFKIEHL